MDMTKTGGIRGLRVNGHLHQSSPAFNLLCSTDQQHTDQCEGGDSGEGESGRCGEVCSQILDFCKKGYVTKSKAINLVYEIHVGLDLVLRIP
jgi:hypothetical protein